MSNSPISNDCFVRLARADELPALFEVEREASLLFKETIHFALAENIPNDQAKYRRFLREGVIYVAIDDHENLLGFALAEEIGCQGFLTELYVHPKYGRRGIGRQLIEAVKEWCLGRGYNEIRLTTFMDVVWNAPYYARLGFQPIKEEDLTEALLEVRRSEAVWGFDVSKTVFMTLRLAPPP